MLTSQLFKNRLLTLFLLPILLLIFSSQIFAQIDLNKVLKKTKKKAEKKIEKRIEDNIDKSVDKTLDGVEDGIEETVEADETSEESDDEMPEENKSANKNVKGTKPHQVENKTPQLNWAKYDFIPGTEIIFEDNQEGEQNGEFPSKWDLVKGTYDNANVDGENVIMCRKTNANGGGGIVPLIKNSSEDYLPDEFTVEFDAYFPDQHFSYRVFFADYKNQKKIFRNPEYNSAEQNIRFYQNAADGKNIEKNFLPGTNYVTNIATWRHIAISFNKRALKVYLDDTRILNIPNVDFNPTGIGLSSHNPDGKSAGYLKNIRIAKGAVPLYDKFLTDGKFVTTGIKFDVNKSTLKPESIGTINYVVKMMQDHPELKFSVEGHTDSDGNDDSNLKLSEERAKSVVAKMIELGISSDRLTSKGLGESKPLTSNDTSEGKAQNRRVEFVKM
ncbi:MAG: OmpA family protein [Ignavibacteriae bacterium]|nr:OmpA family protein [Ignavibacteriota bacterium]